MYKYHRIDVEWSEFAIKEIFKTFIGTNGIQTPTGSYIKKSKFKKSDIPRITVKETNNGIDNFVFSTDKNFRAYKNFISVSFLGGAFYHPYEASIDMKVHALIPLDRELNRYTADFLISTIKNNIIHSSYGNQLSSTDLPRTKIMLPIDKQGNPNWHFMEEYIKERESKQRNDLIEYYKRRLLDLVICPEVLMDVEWGEFSLRDLFVFERGNQNNMSTCESGEIPLISAKKIDNGVKAFISDNGKRLFEGHILTLNNDGDGGVGIAYYQANKMALDTHVTALIPLIPINRSSLLFISKTITIQRDKFSHGYSLNNNRMKAQKIVLPIDKNGNPNWIYMENFIKNIEQKQIKNVLKYLDEYIYIYIYIMYNHFDKVEWKEFFLDEICNIKSGVRLTKANMNEGKMPFIGATDSNNGITNFVSNTNRSLDKNVLGVNYNGSVVENFYHPYPCVFSDDVKRISFKDEQWRNKYCYMFLKQMILQQKEKYRYAYKFNGDRIARQKVMMPVDELGDIDFKFMNRYIASKEMKKLVAILKDI